MKLDTKNMKLGTKHETGYKTWNWVQNMKLDKKNEIGLKKHEIGSSVVLYT